MSGKGLCSWARWLHELFELAAAKWAYRVALKPRTDAVRVKQRAAAAFRTRQHHSICLDKLATYSTVVVLRQAGGRHLLLCQLNLVNSPRQRRANLGSAAARQWSAWTSPGCVAAQKSLELQELQLVHLRKISQIGGPHLIVRRTIKESLPLLQLLPPQWPDSWHVNGGVVDSNCHRICGLHCCTEWPSRCSYYPACCYWTACQAWRRR